MSDRETVFEEGDWTIYGSYGYEFLDTVSHKCEWKKNWLKLNKGVASYYLKNSEFCPHCGDEIPVSILGLWKLNNFDLLAEHPEPHCFYSIPPVIKRGS